LLEGLVLLDQIDGAMVLPLEVVDLFSFMEVTFKQAFNELDLVPLILPHVVKLNMDYGALELDQMLVLE